jgi:hypothetical protein
MKTNGIKLSEAEGLRNLVVSQGAADISLGNQRPDSLELML